MGAYYTNHWCSEALRTGDPKSGLTDVSDKEIYVWADFNTIRAARLRTLVLLTTLLREKYTPTIGEDAKLPEHVFDDAIRECFIHMAEISPPESVFTTDDRSKSLMQEAVQIVDLIDPLEALAETVWIDDVLDGMAEYVRV